MLSHSDLEATTGKASPSPPVASQSNSSHVVPDVGEIGSLPSRVHWSLRTYVSLACNVASFILFLCFAVGAASTSAGSNALAACMLALWLLANALRRLVPLLWTEPGKLTYVRVPAVTSVRVPITLRAHATVSTLLLDALVVPWVLAFSACRDRVASFFSLMLYPPASHSAAPLVVMFSLIPVTSLSILVLTYGFVLPAKRQDPYYFVGDKHWTRVPMFLVTASAGAAVLVLTWATAVLPCRDGHLVFSEGTRCQHAGHHAYAVFAMGFMYLLMLAQEIATELMRRLREDSALPLHEEPRNDALFLELHMFLRVFAVSLSTLSLGWAAYGIIAAASGGLLLYLWSGRSPYVFSSVAVIKDLHLASLFQLTVASASLCLLGCGVHTIWIRFLLWLVTWLASTGLCGYLLGRRYGTNVLASGSTDVVTSGSG